MSFFKLGISYCFSPFLYLINKMNCIQISIQSRMNSLWYEKCYQSTSKQKSCERGCSFFMLSRHNAFWNGGKKSMKVRRRGDTEECFYPWNGAACEIKRSEMLFSPLRCLFFVLFARLSSWFKQLISIDFALIQFLEFIVRLWVTFIFLSKCWLILRVDITTT